VSLPAVGDVIAERVVHLTREELRGYADASGDQNPIHQDDGVAAAVGLPGVIAHGMLTMGLAVQPVVDWVARIGGDARIAEYGVRFTRMVVVDAVAGADVHVIAQAAAIDAEAGTARIDLTVTSSEATVLGKAQVTVTGLA
jgi:acyl dehydratase